MEVVERPSWLSPTSVDSGFHHRIAQSWMIQSCKVPLAVQRILEMPIEGRLLDAFIRDGLAAR